MKVFLALMVAFICGPAWAGCSSVTVGSYTSTRCDDMEVLFHLWRSRLTWVISRVYITEKGGFFFGDGKPSEIDKKLALENIDKCAREEI